jgi:hypothetical protein
MRIELCIDVDIYDMIMLIQASRATKTPIDILIKKAIVEYVEKLLVPQTTPSPPVNESTR